MENATELVESSETTQLINGIKDGTKLVEEVVTNMVGSLETIRAEFDPLAEVAAAIEIVDEDSYNAAGARIVEFRGFEKKVQEIIGPGKKAAKELHTATVGLEKKFLAFVSPHKDAIQKKANEYVTEQERLRREEEARAEEELLKERDKVLAAADRKVKALTEKAASLEDERKAINEALDDPNLTDEEAFALTARLELVNAKIEGNTEKITAQVEKAYTPPVVPIAPATSSAPLKGVRKKMEAQIVDVRELLAALADPNKGLPTGIVKEWNLPLLNQLINNGMDIPGVKSVPVTKASFRK